MTFGTEKKLEWCAYPTVKKFEDILFILIESTNVTDGRTDERTPHDSIGRVHSIARKKSKI